LEVLGYMVQIIEAVEVPVVKVKALGWVDNGLVLLENGLVFLESDLDQVLGA
jgi:hypothetical protein